MKKFAYLVLTILSCFTLTNCNNDNDTKSKLIITEVIEGSDDNKAVELYNISDESIDLSKYTLEIQRKSSLVSIPLNSTLKPKETFVIAYDKSCEDILNKSDMITDKLNFIGSQPIILKKGNKQVDIIGILDNQADYYKDITLARKKEFLVGRKNFDEYDWIRYNCDNFKYLSQIDVSITNAELLQGPKLESHYLQAPFYKITSDGSFVGGGGVMDVKVKYYTDGDTTGFIYDSKIISELGIKQGSKLRYQNIDTPESYEGNVQEFGLVAKAYTKSRLEDAFIIQVQSVVNGPRTETFDRMLGWVWIDGELLNHSIVKCGYSDVSFSTDDQMLYKDISYPNYLYDAQLYAIKNRLGRHGEKDPYWDYENNCVKENISGINPFK